MDEVRLFSNNSRFCEVKTFLQAGVPLCKVDILRDLFEETGYRLTDRRFLFDVIQFILEKEARIKQSLHG